MWGKEKGYREDRDQWWGYGEGSVDDSGSKEGYREHKLGSEEHSENGEGERVSLLDRLLSWLLCPACLRVRFGIGHQLSCESSGSIEDHGKGDAPDDAHDEVFIDWDELRVRDENDAD